MSPRAAGINLLDLLGRRARPVRVGRQHLERPQAEDTKDGEDEQADGAEHGHPQRQLRRLRTLLPWLRRGRQEHRQIRSRGQDGTVGEWARSRWWIAQPTAQQGVQRDRQQHVERRRRQRTSETPTGTASFEPSRKLSRTRPARATRLAIATTTSGLTGA